MRHIRSGFAEDWECIKETPANFTLEGSAISGCAPAPEIVIYGSPDRSGESYTLRNFTMQDMTHFIQRTGDMNDWVRAVEIRSGIWRLYEHVGLAGSSLSTAPGHVGATLELDKLWNGQWDRRISSIRPVRCR